MKDVCERSKVNYTFVLRHILFALATAQDEDVIQELKLREELIQKQSSHEKELLEAAQLR